VTDRLNADVGVSKEPLARLDEVKVRNRLRGESEGAKGLGTGEKSTT
jgi:hypothetical protein